MTYSEIVHTVKKLPYEQRLSLIEMLAHSLRNEKSQPDSQTSSLERVQGMLKVEGISYTDRINE